MSLSSTELRFKNDISDHRMTVLLDESGYRHLRFREAGTGICGFDLLTSPGKFTITGDMGTYVFQSEDDMLSWFGRGKNINPSYWGEKVIAADRSAGIEEYSPQAFRDEVRELAVQYYEGADMDSASAFGEALSLEVLTHADDERDAREALESFEHDGFSFTDTRDLSFTDYSLRYLWCCHAIRWGIQQYRNSTLLKAVA